MKYWHLIALCLSFYATACSKVSNSYDSKEMICGSYPIKSDTEIVHVPGQTMHTMAASLLKPDGTSLELDVTEKGCVLIPRIGDEGSEILFRSKREGIRLAEVMPLTEVLRHKVITLRDMAAYKVKMGCFKSTEPAHTVVYTPDKFEIHAQISSEIDESLAPSRHFKFSVNFPGSDILWNGQQTTVPINHLSEGSHAYQLVARLKAFPELPFTQDCSIVKDSKAPKVQLHNKSRYFKGLDPAVLQMLPAENFELDIEDKNAVTLSTCWREFSVPSCELAPAGKTTISAPSRGSWILHIRAEDQAGNTNDTQWPVVIYEKDKINTISQAALSAQLLAESNRWLEGLKLITRTASDWINIPNADKLPEIESQLRSSFIRLFFDQKPILIQFDNKQNVVYLGNHKFFYTSPQPYLGKEVLKLEIHDFSSKPAIHLTKSIERIPGLGDPEILRAIENKRFFSVRVSINTWKIFDHNLIETRTIRDSHAQKSDHLTYFPDYDLAVIETDQHYYLLDHEGQRIRVDYSMYESSQIRVSANDQILYSSNGNLAWTPKGQIVFNGSPVQQNLTFIRTMESSAKDFYPASYSCDQENICDINLVSVFPDIPHFSKTVKVPFGSIYNARISGDGHKLVYTIEQNTVGVCSFLSGECEQKTLTGRIIDTCIDPTNRSLGILTTEGFYRGQELHDVVESGFYTPSYQNEASSCHATSLGIVLKNHHNSLTIFSGETKTYLGEIDFTFDGFYAMEAGLNSSQIRVWNTTRVLYEIQNSRSESMFPDKHYFSRDGKLMITMGKSFSIYDLSNRSSLEELEKKILSVGTPQKVLNGQRGDELVVQFVNRLSKFDTRNGNETILYSALEPIFNSMDFEDRHLIQSGSQFILVNQDGASQTLSQFNPPDAQGQPICTTFSSQVNQLFLLYEQGTLFRIDVTTGNTARADLEPIPHYPEPFSISNCILHWNEADASLYVANESSQLWRWKKVEGSKVELIYDNFGAALQALEATPSGKIVLIGSNMAFDKILVFDPWTDQISKTGFGIDIRSGWVDPQTKTTYLAGFNGEMIALNPDLEGQSGILWKVHSDHSLSGIIVSKGKRYLAVKTYDGELMSLDLSISSLLKKSCDWLKEANEEVAANGFYCN